MGHGEEYMAGSGGDPFATSASLHRGAPPSSSRSEVLRPSSAAVARSAQEGPERVFRERVLVRVYDLGNTFVTRWHNQVTKSYGAFHTGVEVYGREWSFGMTFDDYSSGVTWNAPGQNVDHAFRETLSMGYTSLSPRQVLQILEEMKVEWKGCTYNVLSRNCHSFSDVFCRRLGVAPLPTWVNDLADTGAQTVDFLDSADSGYDGGHALVDFLGSLKSRMYTAIVGEPEADSYEQRPGQAAPAGSHSVHGGRSAHDGGRRGCPAPPGSAPGGASGGFPPPASGRRMPVPQLQGTRMSSRQSLLDLVT